MTRTETITLDGDAELHAAIREYVARKTGKLVPEGAPVRLFPYPQSMRDGKGDWIVTVELLSEKSE